MLRLTTQRDTLSPPLETGDTHGSSEPTPAVPDPVLSTGKPIGVEGAFARARQILDEEPEFVFWKNRDSVYLGCNQRFAEAAGLTSPGDIVGKRDTELAWTAGEADFYLEVDRRVMANGAPEYHIVESQLQADGRRLWIDTSKVPFYDRHGNVTGVLGMYTDITRRIESANLLSHGTEIFRAMSFAASAMVEYGDWTINIERVLAALGAAVEVSRVTLFSIEGLGDGPLLNHRFEWVRDGFEPRRDRPELKSVPMRKVGLARLVDELSNRRCVHVRVRELTGSERRILEDQKVLSVVIAPVFVENQLWGFLEFDDCATERQWLVAEIEALRSVAGIIGSAIQRRRVERAFRLETRRFEQLFENTPLAILMADADERVLAVNSAFEDLFGYGRDEVVGRQINDLITPNELVEEASRLSRETFSGDPVTHTTVRLHKSGREIPVEVLGAPVTQNDRVALVYGIYVDLTERLKAEAALRESEEKFRSLAEQSLQGIFVVKQGAVAYANQMMAEITGYPLDEFLGFSQTDLERIIHPADRSFVLATANGFEIGDGRVTPQSEYRLISKSGSVKWVLQQTRTVRFDGEMAVEGVLVDITQRKRAEEQLLHSALHDSLTGLPNRASFYDRVDLALERARGRQRSRFAVLFLDLDRFKLINDGFGHAAGDRLLIEIAHRLRRAVRPGDTVARLGGDEFTVLIPDVSGQQEAVSVALRIHDALGQPFLVGNNEVYTTASTGIALSSPRYDNPDEILRDADIAMYQAKSEGRARHYVYDQTLHPQVLSQLHLENDLRRAIERDEFRLFYQPIVEVATGRIVACEALLRWQHPDRGLLPPSEFLSLAEETGLINPIGEWVLRTGCRQALTWPAATDGQQAPAISINLFSRQFSRAELVSFISDLLEELDLPAHRLQLEITESAVIDVPELAIDVMKRLRGLGVKVHLDDFGTGYSSLAYLQRFAVDVLKIDQGFIQRLGGNGGGVEIVRTIVTLARNLGMDALAEGIETPEQLAIVGDLGCSFGQGYLFSKPVPPDTLLELFGAGPMLTP
jgi:diguanylate cyclase (GGDEF)-like protein/PAS domain S-box-containing protein